MITPFDTELPNLAGGKRERGNFSEVDGTMGSPSMSMGSNILAEMCAPMTVIVEAVSQTI